MRIAKATQESDWRRVKALQRMLTRSFSAKALAVKRVTENQGKRTAGVDRELWDYAATARYAAIARLKKQRYTALAVTEGLYSKVEWKGAPAGNPDHA